MGQNRKFPARRWTTRTSARWRCSKRSSGACSRWPPPGSGWRCRASSCRPRRPSSTPRPRRPWRPGREDLAREALAGRAVHRAGAGGAQDAARPPSRPRRRSSPRRPSGSPSPRRRPPHPQGDHQGHPTPPPRPRRRSGRPCRGSPTNSGTSVRPCSERRTRRHPCRPRAGAIGQDPGVGRARRHCRRSRDALLDAELGRAVAPPSQVDAELAKLKAELPAAGVNPRRRSNNSDGRSPNDWQDGESRPGRSLPVDWER